MMAMIKRVGIVILALLTVLFLTVLPALAEAASSEETASSDETTSETAATTETASTDASDTTITVDTGTTESSAVTSGTAKTTGTAVKSTAGKSTTTKKSATMKTTAKSTAARIITTNSTAATSTATKASAATVGTGTTDTAVSAAADNGDEVKIYRVTEEGDKGVITVAPDTLSFWEYPELPAGQQREGTIQIVNGSSKTVDFTLSQVDLPYGDDAALTYLTSLHITIADSSGTVLYDGPYSAIAGTKGLSLSIPSLAPGKTANFMVTLRCAFTYTGDPSQDTSRITWIYKASASTEIRDNPSVAGRVLGIGALVLAGVGVVLLILNAIRRRKST